MRTAGYSRAPVGVALLAGVFLLTSCVTTDRPQQFRTFLLPPQIQPATVSEDPVPEPPLLSANAYANEVPEIVSSFPDLAKPSDADFLLKKSADRFLAGKLALQEGRTDDARREFNQALEVLLNAPDNAPDRARIEQRLEDLIETIYRYDLDQVSAAEPDDNKVSYDKAPLDGILEMTFPVDPSLRNKVKAQVDATVSQLPLEESDAVVGAINFFSTERHEPPPGTCTTCMSTSGIGIWRWPPTIAALDASTMPWRAPDMPTSGPCGGSTFCPRRPPIMFL
jgi:hypothetical protein